jgi:hypothetical protein
MRLSYNETVCSKKYIKRCIFFDTPTSTFNRRIVITVSNERSASRTENIVIIKGKRATPTPKCPLCVSILAIAFDWNKR